MDACLSSSLVAHVFLDVCRIHSLHGEVNVFAEEEGGVGGGELLHIEQTRLAQRTLAAHLAIHRQRAPLAHLGGSAGLACLQQGDRGLFGQAFIVVVVELSGESDDDDGVVMMME